MRSLGGNGFNSQPKNDSINRDGVYEAKLWTLNAFKLCTLSVSLKDIVGWESYGPTVKPMMSESTTLHPEPRLL